MKTILIAVGKAKQPFAEADAHYRKLLSRQQPIEVIEVRDEVAIAAACRRLGLGRRRRLGRGLGRGLGLDYARMYATEGARVALVDILGVKLGGLIGAFIWKGVYLYELGYDLNRAHVLADWTIDLFSRPDTSKLFEDSKQSSPGA